jgi:hypothetical protein
MTLEQLRIFIAVAERVPLSRRSKRVTGSRPRHRADQTGRDFLKEARDVVARAKAAAQWPASSVVP